LLAVSESSAHLMNRLLRCWRSTIGKKGVMPATGIIGVGFLVAQMALVYVPGSAHWVRRRLSAFAQTNACRTVTLSTFQAFLAKGPS
jgi:hypothetical protein